MKKISFILSMLLSFLFVHAQDNTNFQNSSNTFKQVSGSNTFEVNFNPGNIFSSISENPNDLFNLFDGGIKYRKFTSDKKAMRIGINISFFSNVNITQQSDPDNDLLELKDKRNTFSLTLLPGLEKHFSDLNRLSPYIGIQGLIGFNTSTFKSEYQSNRNVYVKKWKNDSGSGSFDIGLGVFAGFDYYFVKKLYFGIEFGYGLQYSKQLNTKFTDENNSSDDYTEKNGSGFGASPTLATGDLRFGWTFE